MSNDQFPVRVVLYPDGDLWIAQGLDYDIVARGHTAAEANSRFDQKFGAELIMSMEIGEKPLSGVPKAPKEYWDKYESIKQNANLDNSPIQVGNGVVSHVQKSTKIAA